MRAGNTSAGLQIGESTSKAIRVLGQPTSVTDYYFEMEDSNGKLYNYSGNELYFLNEKLAGYILKNNSVVFGTVNGKTYKIGDKIAVVTKQVPIGPGNPPRHQTITTKSFYEFPLTFQSNRSRNISYEAISSGWLKNNRNMTLDNSWELLFNNTTLINVKVGL